MPTPLEWTHFFLDGGFGRQDTPDCDLIPLRVHLAQTIAERFPCLGESPEEDLTGSSLNAYQQWLGLEVAIAYVEMGGTKTQDPIAGQFGLVRIESEVGGIKEKLGRLEGRDLTHKIPTWHTSIQKCMLRIPCVKEALATSSKSPLLVARSGRNRSGDRQRC